jgi:alkaline phosphatase D
MFRPKIPEKQKGFYQAYEWNHQLQILLLDIRSFASPFMSVDRPGATPRMQQFIPDCDPSKSMLGVQQWEWLEEMLSRDFDHRLVVSPLQVLATGHGFECWRMLPHERERLLRLLQGKNALIFSGDRHVSALYKANGIYEITASSFTHTVPLGLLDKEFDQTRLTDFCYQNNFGMLEWYYDGGSYFLDATIRSTATGEILMQWLIGKNLGSSILVVGNETRPKGR